MRHKLKCVATGGMVSSDDILPSSVLGFQYKGLTILNALTDMTIYL